jgi:hypothetical protein
MKFSFATVGDHMNFQTLLIREITDCQQFFLTINTPRRFRPL